MTRMHGGYTGGRVQGSRISTALESAGRSFEGR